MTREDAASTAATLHYVRLEPGDQRYHFWRVAKRERVPVEHNGKPHTMLSWTELLDPYRPGPCTVEVTLMLAAAYAEFRSGRRELDRKRASRPARPGGSDGGQLVTRVRQWRGGEPGATRSATGVEDVDGADGFLRAGDYGG